MGRGVFDGYRAAYKPQRLRQAVAAREMKTGEQGEIGRNRAGTDKPARGLRGRVGCAGQAHQHALPVQKCLRCKQGASGKQGNTFKKKADRFWPPRAAHDCLILCCSEMANGRHCLLRVLQAGMAGVAWCAVAQACKKRQPACVRAESRITIAPCQRIAIASHHTPQ